MNQFNTKKTFSASETSSNESNFLKLLVEYIEKNPEEGFLRFQVTSGIVPIEGAEVVISKNIGENSYIGKTLTTDIDGKTEIIDLPTPSKSLSMSPGNAIPYSSYDIRVSKDGYLDALFYDVPVFEGITSIQSVVLKPDIDATNIKYSEPVYEGNYENL